MKQPGWRLDRFQATCCGGGLAQRTPLITAPRGNPPRLRTAYQIHHETATARWWHWSDVTIRPEDIPT